MKKALSLAGAFFWFTLTAGAQKANVQQSGTAIAESNHATHIARITKDSLVVLSGSTCSFTVDTPEDQGLVLTKTGVKQLLKEITSKDGSAQTYTVTGKHGLVKTSGDLETGDHLQVTAAGQKAVKIYDIATQPMAIGGRLRLEKKQMTVNTTGEVTIYFTAGQRSPNTNVRIDVPEGIRVTGDNTTVDVIGRGAVKLTDLARQSMGRLGTNYSYHQVGNFAISQIPGGGSVLFLRHLDLRPSNGADLTIVIHKVKLDHAGSYPFRVRYTTSKPEALTSAGIGAETAVLTGTSTIAGFARLVNNLPESYTTVHFKWLAAITAPVQLLQSLDNGNSWKAASAAIDQKHSLATLSGLQPDRMYFFKLSVKGGPYKGFSNRIQFYSGKMDVKDFGITGDGLQDYTAKINAAIEYLHQIGGGTLFFSAGIYNVRTVHLESNVYLYIDKGATIKALKGSDAPEATWFSDREYRSGLSPTDLGPYDNPENWLTKQDVGHHFFRNCMFFGERLDNVKIIGNGLISGNGNLVNSDKVMNNGPDNRADKMFVMKLCTNIEIGGIPRKEDLWYDEKKDAPYYINGDGSKNFDTGNMLQIERSGHFALLAAGTDGLHVHDTYFGKNNHSNVRDIYDFMECNHVTVTNIYCKVSSDDIIKPGSDCALGFTRPSGDYKIRNVIGDTNCNLFQVGSETADDITDIDVDNIYVLGANKAGFSVSANDGGHVKNICLNCGHTGPVARRSEMRRTTTPFFVSISNRGRILGADVAKFTFDENGTRHHELLVTNVNIGSVENIILNRVDASEIYGGSSYGKDRWKPYDGSQRKATAIVSGYALPDSSLVEGGLHFKLPDSLNTRYVKNIEFNDVHILVKGGNPVSDTSAAPPELGVGQYNVANLKIQPSYGLWARHVKGLTIMNSSFNYEKPDERFALFLDDVTQARIASVKAVVAKKNPVVIKLKKSSKITISNMVYFEDVLGAGPKKFAIRNAGGDHMGLPE